MYYTCIFRFTEYSSDIMLDSVSLMKIKTKMIKLCLLILVTYAIQHKKYQILYV